MDSIARPIPSVDPAEAGDRSAEPDSAIVVLLEGLERAPEESWNAFQGLESLDPDVRGPISSRGARPPAPRPPLNWTSVA